MKKKINIGEKAKVNIKWNVRPVDYTHEGEESIISTFAEKYGISRQNVQVEPVFITKTEKGDTKNVSDGIIGNLYDPKFQQQLFHEYIDDMKIEDIDFNKIIEIDDSINSLINYEAYGKRKKYTVKWIKWSNFMSYGPDNYFDFTTLDGLVLLSSEPANQGGKSTFCLDLLRFLLFGKVTSRENDWTLSRAFNDYLPDATEVKVEGCVEIDGKDYVIERTITRPSLKKRTEKSKVSQTVKYYQYANGEYIDLDDAENMEGDSTKDTNAELGYSVKWKILNALDFGLPQKRERVIIVGFKSAAACEQFNFDFEPIAYNLASVLEDDKNVDSSLFASDMILDKRRKRVEGKNVFYPSVWHENKSGNISILPYACALRTGASYNYLLINGYRRPSSRELLRFQGFPEKFKIEVSHQEIRRQTGNSVAVPMIRAVAKKIIQLL